MTQDADRSPDRTGHGRPRPAKASQDRRVTVEEAAQIFEEQNLPRSKRAIRRYCQRGSLDCTPIDTTNAQEQHAISVVSIHRFIGEQRQLYAATGRSARLATSGQARTPPDRAGPATASLPQETFDLLKGELSIKNRQLQAKDDQIRELLERDRETHILIQQLQHMLPLAASARAEKTEPKASVYDSPVDAAGEGAGPMRTDPAGGEETDTEGRLPTHPDEEQPDDNAQ